VVICTFRYGLAVRSIVAAVVALALAACTGSDPEPAGSPNPATTTSSPNAEVAAFGDLPPCEDDASWLCGSVSVPLDRSDPDGEQLEIAYYVQPHSDDSTPVAEPVFVTPGGPGRNVWVDGKDPIASIASLTANHDIIAVATRGTGASGALDCADFQSGFSSLRELRNDTTACGAQLGDDADRYGGGDVAMDIDAVREALGFETIDYYGFSYATVDAQAYAARFPERLHAVVLDSGLPVSDEGLAFFWGLGVPATLVRVPALYCEQDLACSAGFPNAEADLRRMIKDIGAHPLDGRDADAAGIPADLVVDQTAVAYLLGSIPWDLSPTDLLEAASALENRNPAPLMRLAQRFPPFIPDGDGLPTDFSSGDSAARSCNDQDAVWDRSDPPAARERALAAELDALPANAFTPFTKQTWNDYWWLDMCLGWPVPDRFEPAVPEGAVFDGIPALILAGDLDTAVSTETSRALLEGFADATFLLVRGAGHITIGSDTCAGEIVTTFFDTLDAGDVTCAGPQPPFER
jgi:pimeloyl-ACP methyl ester carboxylesterase